MYSGTWVELGNKQRQPISSHWTRSWWHKRNHENFPVFPVSYKACSVTAIQSVCRFSNWISHSEKNSQSVSCECLCACVCVCRLQAHSFHKNKDLHSLSPFTALHGWSVLSCSPLRSPGRYQPVGSTGEMHQAAADMTTCHSVQPDRQAVCKMFSAISTATKNEHTSNPNSLCVWAAKVHEKLKSLLSTQ